MLKLGFEPEKIIGLNKKSILPAVVIGAFILYFFSISEYTETSYHTMHNIFLFSAISAAILSVYTHLTRCLMSVSVIYVNYMVINNIRYVYGEDYMFSAGYNIWTTFLLPNLVLAFYLFKKEYMHKYWSLFYIFILSQTAIIEKLQNHSIEADSYYFYKHIGMLNYPAFYISLGCIIIFLISYINKGRILTSAALNGSLSLFLAVLMSDNLFAYGLFTAAAAIIWLVSSLYYIYYTQYMDEELSIHNYNSFLYETERKFPLKYSISLMYIDEYERLKKRFGTHKMLILKKMFLQRIQNCNPEIRVYNYKSDSFVLAFPNKNLTESHIEAEDVRRALAKSVFVFNANNHLQLTVSQCVSEKKRTDADAAAVLARAEENLQKACRFTRNITIKS